jgi:2,5-dihydroxypyridine 5,6-dioxygenase
MSESSIAQQVALASLFRKEFLLCEVKPGETVGLLTNLGTRRDYVAAAFHAVAELGAFAFEIGFSALPDQSRVAADGITGTEAIWRALKQCQLLVSFHAPNFARWSRDLRATGTRILAILDGPAELAKLLSPPGLKPAVLAAAERWEAARTVTLLNKAGTNLTWTRGEFKVKSQYGYAEARGRVDHWGAGHITNYPDEGSANGTVVVQPGDLWILPFARVVESEIRLDVRDGFIRKVEGKADAKEFSSWLDRNRRSANDLDPYAISHLGFGLHPNVHRDYIYHVGPQLDRLQAAARAFAGNFLFSTGPNTEGGGKRDTKGHIDMPMCDCTVLLDGNPILENGRLTDERLRVDPT